MTNEPTGVAPCPSCRTLYKTSATRCPKCGRATDPPIDTADSGDALELEALDGGPHGPAGPPVAPADAPERRPPPSLAKTLLICSIIVLIIMWLAISASGPGDLDRSRERWLDKNVHIP